MSRIVRNIRDYEQSDEGLMCDALNDMLREKAEAAKRKADEDWLKRKYEALALELHPELVKFCKSDKKDSE